MIRVRSRTDRLPSVPRRGALGRFLPWIAALSVYLAILGGVGLIAVGDRVRGWDASLAGAMTLQVPADASAARLDTVLALLRQTHGIDGVHVLEPAETARLVEPWLGRSVAIDRLPVPRVIDLHIDGASESDFTGLRQKLASIVPDAQLDAYGTLLRDLQSSAARLSGVIAAVLLVILLIMVMLAASATRAELLIHRDIVELMHLLGADDGHIARPFQARALVLALAGGGAGAIAAVLTMLALGGAGHILQPAAPLPVQGVGDWRAWVVMLVAMIAAAGVTMAAARVTVLRRLTRMP